MFFHRPTGEELPTGQADQSETKTGEAKTEAKHPAWVWGHRIFPCFFPLPEANCFGGIGALTAKQKCGEGTGQRRS